MAVKKGLKKGATFVDNGIKYVVKAVNKDGSYISVRADKVKDNGVAEQDEPKTDETPEENAE